MKRGFSLIELLVVVTIIAILAAVLFPVFAQAKRAALRANDLSNLKQMALAHRMYWNDHDDRTVTSWTYGLPGDFAFAVQPYIKNRAMMLSPGRQMTMEAMSACSVNLKPGGVDNPFSEPRVWGYGYNTGHDWDDGAGLTSEIDNQPPAGNGGQSVTFQYGGVKVTVTYRPWVKQGKALSEIAADARVMLIGNTGDTLVQGMGREDLAPLSMYPALGLSPTACDLVRLQGYPTWGKAIDLAYVDGHAALVPLDLATTGWRIAAGKNTNPSKPSVRTGPKLFPTPCLYMSEFDGTNNPGRCATGDATP